MIEYEVKSRKMPIGKRKGQTVYYAAARTHLHLSTNMVLERIVRETSLSKGDVMSALISLGAVVREALMMGASVDLADLGSLRVVAPSRMMDTAKEVTAACIKRPRVVFTPKADMRLAARKVDIIVHNPANKKPKPPKP